MNNYIRKALKSDYTPPKITLDEAEIMADLRYPAPAVERLSRPQKKR